MGLRGRRRLRSLQEFPSAAGCALDRPQDFANCSVLTPVRRTAKGGIPALCGARGFVSGWPACAIWGGNPWLTAKEPVAARREIPFAVDKALSGESWEALARRDGILGYGRALLGKRSKWRTVRLPTRVIDALRAGWVDGVRYFENPGDQELSLLSPVVNAFYARSTVNPH
ncbi:hypothetical protein D9M68_07930 [compost metagenome]